MNFDAKIFIAGHRGMVGSAILRRLSRAGFTNLICRSSSELDLRDQSAVNDFFSREKPAYVFLAAAKVGGILANNTLRAEFIYDNLVMECNVIHASWRTGVEKLLFLGSSCIYPKYAPQPLLEEYLLTGALEPTNEPYAVAKIAGLKLCEAYRRQYGCNFISAMPTNLYGPNDNYDLSSSHVLPALLRKFHQAKVDGSKSVTLWGTGLPRREFLYVDDLADACYFLMENYSDEGIVNVGTGSDISINELALIIKRIVGFEGEVCYDPEKPDGTFRKVLDVSKLSSLGWTFSTDLEEGIRYIYSNHFLIDSGLVTGEV